MAVFRLKKAAKESIMEYRILGKTGLKVSRMGFGGIPIQRIDAEGTKVLIHRLMEEGVNYIDTARGYTVSEEYLGYALEGIRDKFVLATKSMARTKEAMAADIDTSLRNLRTDYIDLYQIHNPNMEQLDTVCGEGGALEALMEAKAAGKIGHIGLTAHSAAVFDRALNLDFVETIMFPYNIVENQGEKCIAKCREKNIGFIDMKPLAGGAIEDATLALRYVCANQAVDVVIPGMAEESELKENLAACSNGEPLTDNEQEAFEKVKRELGTNFCRRCNYCAPCTVGINIPSVFLFAGYLERYNLEAWARDRYEALSAKASDCVECGDCEARCPYHLPIRQMLKKCAKEFGI
jgi:predicted aldo/keto reductase-like oxidoreductase